MDVAGKVRKLMAFNNMKQKDLSQASGLSRVYISRNLSGKRKPTLNFVLKIAKTFDVSLDWLLSDKD